MLKKRKFGLGAGLVLVATLGLNGCGEIDNAPPASVLPDLPLFENSSAEMDWDDQKILLPEALDSLVVSSLDVLGGAKYFIATDDDAIDPSFDWDRELVSGSVISMADTNEVRIVVLDEENRTTAVWSVSFPARASSSSSSEIAAESSSSKKAESSSSVEVADLVSSSSEETVSSSSEEVIEPESSSSEKVIEPESSSGEKVIEPESSSSEKVIETESSSSEEVVEPESSSSEVDESSSSEEPVAEFVKLSDLSVDGGSINVGDSRIYVEMPYGTDLHKLQLNPLDTVNDLTRPTMMLFEENGEPKWFSVVAGVQLPGSDFTAREDFWATTSDAMATEGSGTYYVVVPYTIKIRSEANAVFDGEAMTLTTRSLTGSSLGIDGGWKMAGGFYYAGSFSGTNAASIYIADSKDAGADNRPANFSQYMTHGKDFNARPVSFDVTYAYNHKKNTNDTYPQQGLIYVALVSADKKIVAAGSIVIDETKDLSTETVKLKYGSDAGLLKPLVLRDDSTLPYVGVSDLTVGTGDEDVASVRVMFASSAYAYVADGGTSSQMNARFRGGEGSQLIVDEFKFNY